MGVNPPPTHPPRGAPTGRPFLLTPPAAPQHRHSRESGNPNPRRRLIALPIRNAAGLLREVNEGFGFPLSQE